MMSQEKLQDALNKDAWGSLCPYEKLLAAIIHKTGCL